MLDEEQEAPAEEPVDVADAGGDDGGDDDAVDVAAMGAEVETADEPAVSAEELMEIPDAPEMPGRTADELTHMIADADPGSDDAPASDDASDLGAQAAAEDAAAGEASADDAPADDAPADDAPAEDEDA